MGPTQHDSPQSAEQYLRGNILVGVDLDSAIPVSGYLDAPNSSQRRSAITPFRGQDRAIAGYHIEINIDARQLGALAWPTGASIPEKDPRLYSLGEALAFFLSEGVSKAGGVAGAIQTFLGDARIKVHSFNGALPRKGSNTLQTSYVVFEFEVKAHVQDAEERVLQFPHPIRRLNQVIDLIRTHGFSLAKEHAEGIHISRHGVRFFQDKNEERELTEEAPPVGPWILGEQIDDLRRYLQSERLLRVSKESVCENGEKRYEQKRGEIHLRLSLRDVPTRDAAENLCSKLRGFIDEQQRAMLDAFSLSDEGEEADFDRSNFGAIRINLVQEKARPFKGHLHFVISLPEPEPYSVYGEAITAQKKGLLFEQFAMMLQEYREALERRY